MADPWQECMDYAITLARKAGKIICEALKEEIAVMVKSSPADLVTVTDQKVENMIISSIKEKYPSHSFIGEESVAAGAGSVLTDNPTWIIDPIDGTTNFVHRFPFVAVSIGFVVNKKMEFGVVFSCVEDKMYTARKGKGAFCNGQKLHVSQQQDITKALIVSELGSSREPEVLKTVLSNMQRLLSIPIHGIRAAGTAAVNMCLVATGGADAYYEMGIHCWDMAGAGVIITEAGGVLLDVSGNVCEKHKKNQIGKDTWHISYKQLANSKMLDAMLCSIGSAGSWTYTRSQPIINTWCARTHYSPASTDTYTEQDFGEHNMLLWGKDSREGSVTADVLLV
ncbi:inositol monophosphatase 1 isoform X1 [Heteronotia binoei]|uniref:inositol monophosphatase 1 isoform X1 n=1 Tax=Heteronotia binoei TaxID=13085 RepID=UPI002930377E|nr:inositol monophosphatase 1 isoform X1 [Heteronotia binoei]XP_060099562.1 inositol monophosphatase 1 isoform X1 [Heteronotia binoei]